MDIDYSTPGKVTFSMDKYTSNIIDKFPEDLGKTAKKTAGKHLFTVRDDNTRHAFLKKKAQIFHRTVVQILFLATRSHHEGRTALTFLLTRVKDPNKDGWAKLRHLLRYLKRNPALGLTLEISNISLIHWWVGASFAIHPDFKNHTGSSMSLGKRSIIDF